MDSIIIALVPDASYQAVAEDPHLTLAYFGKRSDLRDWQVEVIHGLAESLTKIKPYYSRSPKVTGRGIFQVDPEFNEGHSMAYVDLIDDNSLPRYRQEVEERAGFSVNRGHGFIPHITVAFGTAWMPDLARPSGLYAFKWDSVQVWSGDERTVHPLS